MPFLTPDAPGRELYISAIVPDSFLPVVVGAIADCLQDWFWEEYGTLSTDQSIEYINSILDSLQESETPFGVTGMKYLQFLYVVSAGDIVFLTDENGNPLFVLLDLQ